jgi:hypothetical protein
VVRSIGHHIGARHFTGKGSRTQAVFNPATGEQTAVLSLASKTAKGLVTSKYIHRLDRALIMAADTIFCYIQVILDGIEFKQTAYALDRDSRRSCPLLERGLRAARPRRAKRSSGWLPGRWLRFIRRIGRNGRTRTQSFAPQERLSLRVIQGSAARSLRNKKLQVAKI